MTSDPPASMTAEPVPSRTPDDSGAVHVDRTLLVELRRMTTTERLEWHGRMLRMVNELRDGLRR